jgi:gliding motility-associated-like protein
MNQVLTVIRFVFLIGSINIFFSFEKISAQSCNNWLSLPSFQSYVSVGDLDVTGNRITVEATFMRTTPYTGGQIWAGDLVAKHNTPADANYLLRPNNAEITTTNGYFRTPDICEIELNKTYHAAMTYDGATLRFYRNGILMSSVPATGNLFQNNFQTRIGLYDAVAFNTNLIGYINEVRIWNVVRSQAQIQSYMNSSLPAPTTQAGLLAYYTFDNLLNKQGNAAWNGTLGGNAFIGTTNPDCTLGTTTCNTLSEVIPNFLVQDTVCVNKPVNISNTSVNATTYYWNFCVATTNTTPSAVNLGNIGGVLRQPVFSDIVSENGNYYVFVSNILPGGLVRLSFGNSLLNNPTVTDFGNLGGLIPNTIEGIQVVKNEGRWYAIMVGGDDVVGNIPSRILKIDFGININNNAPVGTNWGNIGNLSFPVDLHMFLENGVWYGFTVNANTNTVTRFNFSNSFNNVPTGVNLGNLGGLNYPTGINAIQDNGNWYVFITNDAVNGTIVRLDFGNSLLNPPVAVNLGNPGNVLHKTRDIYIMKSCGQITGLAVNGPGYNDLVKLDFNNNILSVPAAVSLGNTGNMNFPHSISKLFRAGNDLYTFVTNVNNNTITRIRFPGCNNSSIPNSALQNPPAITYATPGTYNINLTIDEGLPTQSSVCKQVVVKDCTDSIIVNEYTPVLSYDICKNSLNVEDGTKFNIGDTVLMIQMKGAVIDSSNTAAFGTVTNYRNAGNYEFNYIKAKNGNVIELLNEPQRQYNIPVGKVQLIRVPYFQNLTTNQVFTCLPWDGTKGGVLVFNVQNALTLNNNIDVSGRGFRGGNDPVSSPGSYLCNENQFYYAPNPDLASEKGEGISDISAPRSFGKGALANGGGGGNSHNSGGAGGSNGNTGGFGGYQFELSPCNSPFDNRGIGGKNLPYNNVQNRIFLGGGGGAGQSNNSAGFMANGGNGGGIVIISAGTINSNNNSINANGASGMECPGLAANGCHEGMGGGGGGGVVLLNVNAYAGNLNVNTRGGKGADMIVAASGRLGPGGGGSGGVVWVNSLAAPVNLLASVAGGISGVNTGYANDNWGATQGNTGSVLTGLQLPVSNVLFTPNIDSVRIATTVTGCSSFSFAGLAYTNTHPINSWQWYFGDGGTATTQNTSHTYSSPGNYTVKLVVTDINGCKDSITTAVVATTLNFDFSYKQDVCNPLAVQFNGVGNSLNNAFWDFGDGNTSTGNANVLHTYTATGDYLVKFSIGNGVCSDTIRKTISINVVWDNLILTPDTTICYGATKQLRTVPSLSFCWTPTSYLDNPLSVNPTTSATQDITYYFTAEVTGTNLIANGNFSSGNTGFTSQYNFANNNTTEGQYFVGANPSAWNGSLSACGDHTAGNGNMMLVNGTPIPDVNVWRQTVTVTPNANYAFSTWIQALWPPNPAQLQFSINGKDVGQLITASLPTCTWTQFYTTWNSGNSTTAIISIVNKNTAIQGNDFALDDISFAPVFIRRDSVIIGVENPLVRTNADTTICPGGSVQLNTTGAQTYTWSPAAGLSNTGIANPVATPAALSQYIVTGTTVNGCIAKDTVAINLFAKPAIVVSNDTAICRNAQVQLSATGGVGYNWTPAATLSNPLISNPVASPTGNTKYYVTIIDNNTCQHLDSVLISLRPDAVFAVNTPAPVCRLDSVQLNASGGNIYSWQPANGLSNATIANPKAAPDVTTDYNVTITETTCNQSQTLVARVTVIPLPAVNAVKANDIDCRNAQAQLTASGASQYVWSPSATLNNSSIFNPIATPATSTQYIVTGTNANGCSAKDTINVDVFSKPTIVVSDDVTICKNGQTQLNVNVSGSATYNWSPAATLNNPSSSNPVASPLVSTKYYVTITDVINCQYLDSVEVSVRPDAVFSINSPGQVCKDGSFQLNASGGDIYSWQPAGGLSNTGISNPIATPLVTTDYSVTIRENTCNQATTLTTRVTVLPVPTITATKSNDIDCSNDRSQLSATGAVQYLWAPATTLNNPALFNPVATPLATTDYIVEGTDASGCKGYDTISVKVDNVNKGGYLMPSAFTPNKDGLNDCYGIKYWGVIEELEFSIYNRWGQRIYFTKNAGQCWDGTYKGVEQDGGVYVYVIKAKTTCQPEVFRKGTFVLVR